MCTPDIWIQSFQKVNLQPSTRVSFEQWYIRIKEKLETGSFFDLKLKSIDRYTLLPSWWHLMIPQMKKIAFNIVESSGGFTTECVLLLNSECLIGRCQLQHFLCCYGNAVNDRSQLDQSGPVALQRTNDNSNDDVSRIETNARVGVVQNLSTYQLKPEGMKGVDLFSHMIGYRELNNNFTNGSKYTIAGSQHLNLEINKDNISILETTNRLLAGENIESKRLIYQHDNGYGRTKILRNFSSGGVLHFKYRYDVILTKYRYCTRNHVKYN